MKYFNKTIIHFLLLAIAVLGLYWQTTDYEFVLDDKMVISENNFVKEGIAGIPDIFNDDSMTGFLGKQPNLLAGGRYRPLSIIVFAAAFDVWGLNTFNFHLLNLLFYLAALFVLYICLLRLFQLNKAENQNRKIYLFIAVLLFGMHPVHTEAVANIKGLDEILAFLFGTLSMFLLLVFYDSKKIIYAVLSAISFLLSLLAKESTLPLILAIPVTFYFFRNSKLKTVFSYIVILLVPTIVYLVIRNQALGFLLNNDVNATGIMNDPYFDASFSQKIGTILYTLLIDIKLLFLPHPLTHDYYPYHIQLLQIFHPLSLLSVLLLGGLIWIAVKGIKTRNKISWIIFYFFVTISIVSNVVINVGAFTNERFLFVPSLAFSVLVIWLFEKFSKTKTILFAISALFIVGFALKSYTRIPVWENEKTLNKAAVLVSKNSARSNCFYGVSLYNEILKDSILEEKTAKIIEAQKYINRSLEIYPEYADALRMKAGLAGENYKIDRDADKVLAVFKEILEVRHLAFVDEFTNWLERRTDKNKMLQYYFDVGYANFAVKKQNFSWANFYLQKGFKLDPTNKNILFGNCIISYLTSDYKKSIEYGNSYLNIHGENAEMYFYLGNAQIKNGEPQTGRQNIEKAYQLKPELKNQKLN